jgi:transposase
LFAGLNLFVPHLKKIWADGAYDGKELERWLEQRDGWELEVIERDREAEGLRVLPRRWVVERTFGWLSRNRRLAKDYERRVQTSETLIEVATIRLLVRRLARSAPASPNTL